MNTEDQLMFKGQFSRNPNQIYIRRVLRDFITQGKTESVPQAVDLLWLNKTVMQQGLFAIVLKMISAESIPPDISKRWQHASILVLMKNNYALQAALELLSICKRNNIPAVALRGVVLAHSVYCDPMLRPMTDVDILVPNSASEELLQLREKYFWSSFKRLRSQYVLTLNRTKVEIHLSFLTPKRYKNIADFNFWLDNQRTISTPKGFLDCLSPEHELLGLVFHWYIHHELEGYLKGIDIALLILNNSVDWDYVVWWCKRYALTRIFCFTMAYVNFLFGLNLSPKALNIEKSLPLNPSVMFDAFIAPSIDQDHLKYAMRRKMNQLFVAESFSVKLKQAMRYMDLYELMKKQF